MANSFTFFVSVVLDASKFEAGQLLQQHLKMLSAFKKNGYPLVCVLREWQYQINSHFGSFDAQSVISITEEATQHLSCIELYNEHFYILLSAVLTLISRLYRRNRSVDELSKNERTIAKESLQELLNTLSKASVSQDGTCPIQFVIIQSVFSYPDTVGEIVDRTPCDYELMVILLDCNIDMNEVDSAGSTMLHAVLDSFDYIYRTYLGSESEKDTLSDLLVKSLRLLLEKGVNPNARNKGNALASDVLLGRVHDENGARFFKILKRYEHQNSMTLQHKAAVAVKESKLPYEDLLPSDLVKLVNLLGNKPQDNSHADSS